ncbi:MAG: B12-binding domain-containing protein [Deltaproteobacteria bacterium]
MSNFKSLTEAVIKGDIQTAVAETQTALDAGAKVQDILDQGLISAMDEVGEKFSTGQMFVPQMLRSAKTMQECMKLIKPLFQEGEPDIVAMSALLSTTMPAMRKTIEALQEAGIRDQVKVMIGGAPVTENFAREIKADSYAPDAGSAVMVAKKLLSIS